MKKIVVLMAYYNRKNLLLNTLESLKKSTYSNFEVLVMDDGSDEPFVTGEYPYSISVHRISKEEKKWNIYLIPMNIGAKIAINKGADIIMFQNAEARHVGDVISYTSENLTEENYLSFACYSLSKESTFNPNLDSVLPEIISSHNVCASDSDHDSWYNHPLYRGTGYDFCAAVTKDNLIRLNGYDERYAEGVCYCDDDLVMRVKRAGLKIEIPTDPFVAHQWHKSSGHIMDFDLKAGMNKELYYKIANEETGCRAKHIYTEDL